ncbi:hypothetical protein N7466_009311 [Penicillium verhagenii]|uniref:uncharacterized protein n=1 Tax=Penicillium verhagenii TaxID=1562060 RepID=UPI002545A515|nr:uncharacterized protein N7466_009311 [Penicillium verhagenii]KAJ5920985.1 hypothetical protein N7466_009311 [Penicillium verhagenii]
MFGWGPGLGLASVSTPPEEEREAPSQPTPLDFPVYRLPDVVPHPADSTLHDLSDLLASIKRPQDICLERFAALNLKVDHDVDIRQMFPETQPQPPPLPWDPSTPEVPAGEDELRPLMSNGLPYPTKDRFDVLQAELLLDDDDVFREVARLPLREGRDRVRVTQTRKFWTALERMAQYWDTSLDNYFERPATPQRTPPSEAEVTAKADQMQIDNLPDVTEAAAMDVDQAPPVGSADREKPPHPTLKMYTGRRSGSGSEMPEDVRDETVRAFIEMAAWPFGCQVNIPTLPPRLTVKNLLFPVRQSLQSARSPRDRQVARNGILEGPVLIAQCRPETGFRNETDAPGAGMGEVCDLFREVGGMLLAAQERAREGGIEIRPGEGKWWTTRPRFGGATSDGILEDLMNGPGIHGIPIPDSLLGGTGEDKPSMSTLEDDGARKRHKLEHPFVTSLARRPSAMRKLSSVEKWQMIQPGPSLWDKRMRYMQIGKAADNPFDDIYMISAINHHIAILHLRVHRRYLEVLTDGESDFSEESTVPDQPWHVLKLQRTRWYNLLDTNDRIEALKGVWSLFHYQQRAI